MVVLNDAKAVRNGAALASAVYAGANKVWPKPAPTPPLTGLVAWWDASDPATLTLSGSNVTRWADKSGAGHHAIAAAPVNGPIAGTRQINGKPALDWVSHHMSCYPPAGPEQPLEIIAVLQADQTATTASIFGWSASPEFKAESNVWMIAAPNQVFTFSPPADFLPHVIGGVFNGATSSVWRDGVSIASGDAGTTGYGQLSMGAKYDDSAHWDGAFGEILMYNRVLSTTERQQANAYLKAKWGTP